MHIRTRFLIVAALTVITVCFLVRVGFEDYSRDTSNLFSLDEEYDELLEVQGTLERPEDEINWGIAGDRLVDDVKIPEKDNSNIRRANATFVMLAKNTDVDNVAKSVREIEDRFNNKYHYPYVFLSIEPYSEEFKKQISVLSDSVMEFGAIAHDDWFQPEWIDEDRAAQSREMMKEKNIKYADSVPYRNMRRFSAGFLFQNELLQRYQWYWGIDPSVHFHCNIAFDPFLLMMDNNKVYGFTVSLFEDAATIPTLWKHVKDFLKLHPEFIDEDNSMGFISEDGGETYNRCHFWSDVEIGDMDFWRGSAYTEFFKYLDSKGGFYYELWGNAEVHSIAASLFLQKDQIHFFDELSYERAPYSRCPKGEEWTDLQCSCNKAENFDNHENSCLSKWNRIFDGDADIYL